MFVFSCDFFVLSRLLCSINFFFPFKEKRKAFSCLSRQRTQHENFRKIDIDRERDG